MLLDGWLFLKVWFKFLHWHKKKQISVSFALKNVFAIKQCMPSNVKKRSLNHSCVPIRYILWPRKSKMHNLIFCCLCIVAASEDGKHSVFRADSNNKKMFTQKC